MARYIDADKAMEEINRIGGHNLCEWETLGVKALIDRQPTADVAPKSEVAMEIFAGIDTTFRKMISVVHDAITEAIMEQNDVALSSYKGALTMLDTARMCIHELKKKYTEGNDGR